MSTPRSGDAAQASRARQARRNPVDDNRGPHQDYFEPHRDRTQALCPQRADDALTTSLRVEFKNSRITAGRPLWISIKDNQR
jgi:hypothetical protein